MLEILRVASEKGFIDTSWDELEFMDSPLGRAALVDIGDEDHRPLVAMVDYAPGTEVPVHYHGTDYCSIVVEGEIEITRKMHRPGSIRVVRKGTAYGPLKIGPQGCKVIDIFADRTGIAATFLNTDEARVSELTDLQADVTNSLG